MKKLLFAALFFCLALGFLVVVVDAQSQDEVKIQQQVLAAEFNSLQQESALIDRKLEIIKRQAEISAEFKKLAEKIEKTPAPVPEDNTPAVNPK